MKEQTRTVKCLLTNRNSAWGVMVNPVATNTYQHILSWENEEVKDWFVNKYLFGDENFDYKAQLDNQPSNTLIIRTASRCQVKIGTDQDFYKDMPKHELLNKDILITVEEDKIKGTKDYRFWAINNLTEIVGHLLSVTAELDLFFTYNIKDMFKDSRIGIARAHTDRYIKDAGTGKLRPNVFKNSIGSLPEDFFQSITEFYPKASDDLLDLITQENMHSYLVISTAAKDFTVAITGFKGHASGLELTVSTGNESSVGYGAMPYAVVDLSHVSYLSSLIDNEDDWLPFLNALMSHSPLLYAGIISIPFALHIVGNGTDTLPIHAKETNSETDYDLAGATFVWPSGLDTKSIEWEKIMPEFDKDEFTDISLGFRKDFEGKIYHSDINQLEVIDGIGSSYTVPFSKICSETDKDLTLDIAVTINTQGVFYKITPKNLDSINHNYNYGLEGDLSLQQDRSVDALDQYQAYNKSQFDNSIRIAKRHEVQAKTMGSMETIMGFLNGFNAFSTKRLGGAGGIFGGGSAMVNGANEIANAKDELNTLLAQQTDMRNAPDSVTNGSPQVYLTAHNIMNSEMQERLAKKTFLEAFVMTPRDIILEKVAWLLHLSGWSFGGLLYNINELLDSRFYFNYIQTTMSVFENFREDITISQENRHIIDESLMKGLTIWHIRSAETFKGVKQFDVNNVEMNLLESGD